MTLTTEQLRARAKFWREKAVKAKWESVSIAQDMLQNADAFDELAANREAQPVIVVGDDGGDALAYRRLIKSFAPGTKLYAAPPAPEITDEAIDRIVVPLSLDGLDEEKHHCEWHLYHDRERIRKELREYFTSPPAPAVPEDVQHLKNVQELYHSQEERLFALAQRIKGASFDKYSHSTAQAIDVLEREIFGDDGDACRAAMLAPRSPADLEKYTQGVKDGLEWAARTVEANHPNTGDWLYDDRDDLAKAIRRGPDMLAAAPGGS